MEAIARARHLRISPRKMRLVVDMIRGLPVEDALVVLQSTRKKASPMVEKTLRSAVANAMYIGEDEDDSAMEMKMLGGDAGVPGSTAARP